MAGHFGRDWAGRLMLCILPDRDHKGKCVGSHGGRLKKGW